MATIQLSVACRNRRLDSIETECSTSAVLRLRTGSLPSSCGAANSGTVVSTITLTSDWAAAASNGSKAFNNTPFSDTSAALGGTLGHFRLYQTDGTTCVMQGDITATGGGGALTVDNTSVNQGQQITITSWTITDGNA